MDSLDLHAVPGLLNVLCHYIAYLHPIHMGISLACPLATAFFVHMLTTCKR